MSMQEIKNLRADKIQVDGIESTVLYADDIAYDVLNGHDATLIAEKFSRVYPLTVEETKKVLETLQAPEFIEEEIRYVKSNPDISWWKKCKLIRVLKKELKERRKNGRCKEM